MEKDSWGKTKSQNLTLQTALWAAADWDDLHSLTQKCVNTKQTVISWMLVYAQTWFIFCAIMRFDDPGKEQGQISPKTEKLAISQILLYAQTSYLVIVPYGTTQ